MALQELEPQQNYEQVAENAPEEVVYTVRTEQEALEHTAAATRKAINFMRSVRQHSL